MTHITAKIIKLLRYLRKSMVFLIFPQIIKKFDDFCYSARHIEGSNFDV